MFKKRKFIAIILCSILLICIIPLCDIPNDIQPYDHTLSVNVNE